MQAASPDHSAEDFPLGFIALPRWIYYADCWFEASKGERDSLLAIANAASEAGVSQIGTKRAAMRARCSTKTVERAVRYWRSAGVLSVLRRGNQHGSSVYQIAVHPTPCASVAEPEHPTPSTSDAAYEYPTPSGSDAHEQQPTNRRVHQTNSLRAADTQNVGLSPVQKSSSKAAADSRLNKSERDARERVEAVLDEAGVGATKRASILAIDGIELVMPELWSDVKVRPARNHAGLLVRVIEDEAAERIAKHRRKRAEREARIPAVAASAEEIASRREAEATAWRVLRTVENFDELALLARDRATPAERGAWGDRPPDQCLDLAIAMAKLARARCTG
ncbi:MAG: hypothetical protein AAF328_00395 [Planctomycetota bacterium]